MLQTSEKRRISFIGCIFAIIYSLLIIRLYYLQIMHHDFFTALGIQQYTITVTQPTPRAVIYDRYHTPLALNKDGISAFIMPNSLKNPSEVELFLQQELPCAYQRLQEHRKSKFMYIARHITPELQKKIELLPYKDIHLMHEPGRMYTNNACLPIVGSTNIDNKGQEGIELSFESQLAGKPAVHTLQKDARSGYFYFNQEQLAKGHAGNDIQLTIDSSLQFLIHKKLKKHVKNMQCAEGGVVIIDPATGDILTMSSYIQNLPNDNHNTCITNAYEFGSVCKLFVAACALEEKVVTIDELVDCKNKKTVRLDGRTINTWKAHGVIPFKEVISKSNNIGIAIVAKRLETMLYEHYKNLGFGKKLSISLPGKNTGFINHPAHWSKQSLISLSYGYEISTTLLHLAVALTPFAHHGCKVEPRLVMHDPITIGPLLYAPETVEAVREILHETTAHGTAHRAQIKGYNIMCKTGSAHMVEKGTYNEDKNIYSCIGIVEKDAYQRIIALYVQKTTPGQKETFASTIAAPLFEKVAETMLTHDHIIAS